MNSNDLYEAIGELKEETLEKKPRRHTAASWSGVIAALLALALGVGMLLSPGGSNSGILTAHALAQAEYPQMTPYPEEDFSNSEQAQEKWQQKHDAWREDVKAQRRQQGYADGLSPFFAKSMETFLHNSEGENRICSPLNIYMALGMLAEITGGESRQEILDVLGAESIDGLRKQANDVWNAQYRNDNATFMILANSLWLRENMAFQQETLDTLAKSYYASSYSGTPGSEDMDKALQEWLNEQTGGLLKEQTENIMLTPDTILALASTLRYQAKWAQAFREDETAPQEFHGTDGVKTLDFLHSDGDDTYYWAEHFGAVGLRMENDGGTMWLLLPDEGITPEQLLEEAETYEFLSQGSTWEQQKRLIVHFAMPKFDVSSQYDLGEGLKSMGIRQVFSPETADYSPLLSAQDGQNPSLSQCSHAVRVAVDEEGITAAAFVEMATCGACPPPDEEITFSLDRPFLFVVNSPDGLPLLSGIVNRP